MTETSGDQQVTESEGITAEDLKQIEERNAELRAKIEEANAETARLAAANEVELQAAQLLTEQARLEAELKLAEAQRDSVEAKEGNEVLMAQVKEQLRVAVVQADAQVGAVDTNANRKNKDEGSDKPADEGETVVTTPTPTSGSNPAPPVTSPKGLSEPPAPPTTPSGETPTFLK